MKNKILPKIFLVGLSSLMTVICHAQPIYPTLIRSYQPGTLRNGSTPLPQSRSNGFKALAVPENSDSPAAESNLNFVSLGFGGKIDLEFEQPFRDGQGLDLHIHETTYRYNCSQYPEKANVFVSQTGEEGTWVLAGGGCLDIDIELPDNMPWARFVRVLDVSQRSAFSSAQADGFDLDGITAYYRDTIQSMACQATAIKSFLQGRCKNGQPINASRSLPDKALGSSSGSDDENSGNFVSLGFDNPLTQVIEGELVLEFAYTVFDKQGADLRIIETTFGDHLGKSDESYPEMAEFWGSNDGSNYFLLSAIGESPLLPQGRVVRDGMLDINAMPEVGGVKTLRYLKVIDRSTKASNKFSGSADGYDIDAIQCADSSTISPVEDAPQNEDSDGEVTLEENPEKEFNPILKKLKYRITGAYFDLRPQSLMLYINDKHVQPQNLVISPDSVEVTVPLFDGENRIYLSGTDSLMLPYQNRATLWAGNNTMTVVVQNEDGTPASNVTVRARLADDPNVEEVKSSNTGTVTFSSLPGRTILLAAKTPDNKFGTSAAVPSGSNIIVKLIPFYPPSPIDNNDFSNGLEGWQIGTTPAQIIPHQEGNTGGSGFATANGIDNDLKISTLGEGPRTVSRSFTKPEGISNVRVRYRFITAEVPGGYFGSKYNDYFAVTARSMADGKEQTDQNNMNALGLASFDVSGATQWKELILATKEQEDVIQFDFTVANVADALYQSNLVVDIVDETDIKITTLDLLDIDHQPLTFISLDAHGYNNANPVVKANYTSIHGRIAISGPESKSLSSLKLQALQGQNVIAEAELVQDARAALYADFGSDKVVEILQPRHLFELPSAGTPSGTVTLRLVAKSVDSKPVEEVWRKGNKVASLPILKRFNGARYSNNVDLCMGGDAWAMPHMLNFVNQLPNDWQYNDYSNMNGGFFGVCSPKDKPHAGHRKGIEADFRIPSLTNSITRIMRRDGETAQILINVLNSSVGGSIVEFFVTYAQSTGDPFWEAIKNVQLNDGRMAKNVIKQASNHADHFHITIADGEQNSGNRIAEGSFNGSRTENKNKLLGFSKSPIQLAENPVTSGDDLRIRFESTEPGEFQIHVKDIHGKLIATQPVGFLSAGISEFYWNVADNTGGMIPQGIYLLTMVNKNSKLQATSRFVIKS